MDFNKQLFFDPKINIVGNEVPLAAMEQTGKTLQEKYDKSYEQYSIADEALKQMEASANEIDRQKAKELRQMYSEEMKGIVDRGDFHNMRHQVSSLARNAAANYKTIAERNQQIQSSLDAISKDPRYSIDPEGAKQDFLRNLNPISINPETRTVSNFNVGTYGAAADVNIAEKALKIAPTIRTKTRGGEDAKFVQQMFEGQPVWTKVSNSGKTEYLSANEINSELSAYLKTDPEVQSYIARDINRMGLDINSDEGKQAYNQLLNERINSSTKALGQMYSVNNKVTGRNVDIIGGAKALGIGNQNQSSMGVPVNTLADSYGPTSTSLRETLVDGLRGQKGNVNNILNFLNSNINSKEIPASQKQEYSKLKQTLTEVDKLKPEQKEKLSKFFALNMFSLSDTDTKFSNLADPKLIDLAAKLNQHIGTVFSLDTDTENKFSDYTKNNQGFQNINLLTPHYQDAETINHLQTWMSKSLAANDFKTFKGELDPKADYSFSKVSDKPIGNGTGIVIELKNNKDNSTVLVEPKDSRMLWSLESTFPGIVTANTFKNTSDFNMGEERSIENILKENSLPPSTVPKTILNNKIKYNKTPDGMAVYELYDSNGKFINAATSYLDLL